MCPFGTKPDDGCNKKRALPLSLFLLISLDKKVYFFFGSETDKLFHRNPPIRSFPPCIFSSSFSLLFLSVRVKPQEKCGGERRNEIMIIFEKQNIFFITFLISVLLLLYSMIHKRNQGDDC